VLRVVLDTNVVLSGLLKPEGTPGKIVAAWRASHYRLVLSEFLIAEIADAIGRGKIAGALGWSPATITRFMIELRAFCEVVEPAEAMGDIPRDPDDAPVLATLVGAAADVLVSGDKDLLVLADRYPIESPAQFAARL
jgi:putative PIN family toxin of toxin-antitoxin system